MPVNTAALRAGVINTYNGRAPANRVTDEVNAIYANRFPTIQREAVFDALKHLDGARFAQLEEYGRKNGKEDEIKNELYQQIYRNFLNTAPIAGTLTAINTYNNFRSRFSADARDRNNDNTIIGSANTYEQYLHNNLPVRIEDYIKDELARLIKNDHANNMRLKTELSGFLTDIEERKNDDEQVGGQRIHQATEANIGTNDEMIKRRRKRLLGISRGRPDVSYMRFYNGASHEIKDQKVDISTNTRIEDLKNPEPVKYDVKTDIA